MGIINQALTNRIVKGEGIKLKIYLCHYLEGTTNKKAKELLDSHIIVTVYKKDTIGSVLEQIKRILKL